MLERSLVEEREGLVHRPNFRIFALVMALAIDAVCVAAVYSATRQNTCIICPIIVGEARLNS